MFLACVDEHSTGGLGQMADLANSQTTTQTTDSSMCFSVEASAIELCWLGLKCQADLASHWTLVGGRWISGQSLCFRTEGCSCVPGRHNGVSAWQTGRVKDAGLPLSSPRQPVCLERSRDSSIRHCRHLCFPPPSWGKHHQCYHYLS